MIMAWGECRQRRARAKTRRERGRPLTRQSADSNLQIWGEADCCAAQGARVWLPRARIRAVRSVYLIARPWDKSRSAAGVADQNGSISFLYLRYRYFRLSALALFSRFDTRLGTLRASPEAIEIVTGFHNVAVMREAIEQCRGEVCITEHARPLCEAQV